MPLEPATSPPTPTPLTISSTTQPTPLSPSSTTNTPPPPPPSAFPTRPIALSLLIACPLLILAPPRKLDFYTFSLASAWAVSARHLYTTTSSTSSPSPSPSFFATPPPSTAPYTKKKGTEEEERRGTKEEQLLEGGMVGMARRLWMGDEKPGWEKKRMEVERERLGEGYGIGDLIRERVGEVFGEEQEQEGEGEGEGRSGDGEGRSGDGVVSGEGKERRS